MTEVAIRTTRFAALTDLASAYSLAYVLQLYVPIQVFTSRGLDPTISQAVELAILGGLLSSFLFIVDPINKAVRVVLTYLLQEPGNEEVPKSKVAAIALNYLVLRKRPPAKQAWARQLINMIDTPWLQPDSKDEYSLAKARTAYWSPYLAKLRAQMSGGGVFLMVMAGLLPFSIVQGGILIPLLLSIFMVITFYSLRRDLRYKAPACCWIVAVYGLTVESKSKDDIRNLDIITRHLRDSNWEEASQWLKYELQHKSQVEKPRPSARTS